MTCLRNHSCLLYLLLSFCCGNCLDRLEPLGYDFDDDTLNNFEWNEELNRANYSRVGGGCKIRILKSLREKPGLQGNGCVKLRDRRSCELPEAAFIFKQVMVPESDVKTFSTVCREQDAMNLLKFQGQRGTFRRPSGLSEYGNSEESIEENGMVFKETIGFEIPENSKSGSKGQSFQGGNMVPEIDHRAKCRLGHDTRSNRAKVAMQEILARVQTVEKLKGRARREIRYRKFRATPKPKWDSSNASHETGRTQTHVRESGSKKQPKEKAATTSRPWQEKLWDNIRRSSFAQQKQSSRPSSSYAWKFLHMKSQSVTTNVPVPERGAKYNFRRFLTKSHSAAESQPRAMHPGRKHCAPTKLSARPHKGHYCHYHYKNHRIREQQAFHRLKANTKLFLCTRLSPGEELSTGQSLDEDAIMSTLGMDLSEPTENHQVRPTTTTATPIATMPTYPVWTHFQHVPTTVVETTISPETFSTAVTAYYDKTTDTPTTESPTMTSSPTHQIETTTTQLTPYLTTINITTMTGDEATTGSTVKEVDVRDDKSATAEVSPETDTTMNYVHRKRFRKT